MRTLMKMQIPIAPAFCAFLVFCALGHHVSCVLIMVFNIPHSGSGFAQIACGLRSS